MERDERITGLAYDPSDPLFGEDPSDYYRWLRDEEPVHWHSASGAFLISRFQDIWDLTADWHTFSSQSAVGKMMHMASLDPPLHDRLRSSVSRFFTPRRVAEREPLVRTTCRELLDSLDSLVRGSIAEPIELVSEFATIFPSRVIHRILGVPSALDEPLRACALGIGAAEDAASMAERMSELEAITSQIVAGDSEPGEPEEPGLIQILQSDTSNTSHSLSHDELRGICSNLVLAGSDTVTNVIGNGLVLLQRHPDARRRLAREPSLIPAAVEEMLRFQSPVQSLARRARHDVVLRDVPIPADSELRLLWGAANLDEREFDRPDVFDIERKIDRHLALGHSIHFCIGASLARLELRVAFEEILSRWPEYRVDETRLARARSLWVRAWEQIFVELA